MTEQGSTGNGGIGGRNGVLQRRSRSLLAGVSFLALAATPAIAEDWQQRLRDMETGAAPAFDLGSVQLAQATTAEARRFDIPARDLQSALLAFSQAVDLQLLYPAEMTAGLTTQGVQGEYTPEEALRRLLAGTALNYRFSDANTVTLAKASAQDGDGPLELQPVTVEGLVSDQGQAGLLGERKIRDIPFSITSYTERTIEDQQARSISDVLDNDSSVRSISSRTGVIDQFIVRGFPIFNSEVAVDGIFGVSPNSRTLLEPFERVEVFKGPNTLVNGLPPLGNIGGVINLVPKTATLAPLTEVNLNYESDTNVGGHVDFGRRFGPDQAFGVRFNGVFRDGDMAIDDVEREDRLASLNLDYRGDRLRASTFLLYQDTITDGAPTGFSVGSVDALPSPPDSEINPAQPWEVRDFRTLTGLFNIEYDVLENWTAQLKYSTKEEISKTENTVARIVNADGTTSNRIRAADARDDRETIELNITGFFNTGSIKHELIITGNQFSSTRSSQSGNAGTFVSSIFDPITVPAPNFPNLSAPFEFENNLTSYAISDTARIWDGRLQVTGGLRFQEFDSTFASDENAFSPAVGVTFKPSEPWSIYASFSQGLSPGPFAPGVANNAGEEFDPFVAEQYEVGVKADFDSFGASAAAFQISQEIGFVDPNTNNFVVDGEVRNRGLEFNVFGDVTEYIAILGGLALMDAEQTSTAGGVNDGNRAPGVPRVQFNLYGEYRLPFLYGVTLTGRAIYTSKQFLDGANTLSIPSWTRFDVGARYQTEIRNTPVTVRLDVRNVADNDYWSSTARGRLSRGAPRTVFLSTSFRF